MSDGDDDPNDAGEESGEDVSQEALEERLDAAEEELEAAETEADLDQVEATLDGVEADLEAADLPEPEDEDEEGPREAVESRLEGLRDELEDKRGPYAEDVVAEIEGAKSTIEETRWTETGRSELVDVVETFLVEVEGALGEAEELLVPDDADPDELAVALDEAAAAVEDADLDPDDDEETIATLLEAAEGLQAGVEDAEAWDDLSVRQKLRYEGFYDVLGEKHKDYPPEWSALKEWEKRDDAGMVLLLLDHMGDSGFIERHCLESLKRMGNAEAFDEMNQRAGKRDKDAIEVLGKIGDERALDTIAEYVDADSDPALQRVALRAIGEIGSEESVQPVANKLAAEDSSIRSAAARTLGLLGDERAVEPLSDALADDDENAVRASAAWALVQIGTEDALEAAAEYADDDAYIVQTEAETADDALRSEDAQAAP